MIVVKNDVKDKAYFGDLNGNIAVRSGAVGAVVDSYTRDSVELNGLEFSVFAHGINCDDIKYEGTVHAMNRPVTIGDVTINTAMSLVRRSCATTSACQNAGVFVSRSAAVNIRIAMVSYASRHAWSYSMDQRSPAYSRIEAISA